MNIKEVHSDNRKRDKRLGKRLIYIGGFCWLFAVIKANLFGVSMDEYWIMAVFIIGMVLGLVGLFIEKRIGAMGAGIKKHEQRKDGSQH